MVQRRLQSCLAIFDINAAHPHNLSHRDLCFGVTDYWFVLSPYLYFYGFYFTKISTFMYTFPFFVNTNIPL